MSAFLPLATKLRTLLEVRFVPKWEVARLSFDHLVDTTEQREWDREAQGLGVDQVFETNRAAMNVTLVRSYVIFRLTYPSSTARHAQC